MNNFVLAFITNDIALPIPASIGLLEVLIIVTFILHILFVNFTISLSSSAVLLEVLGIVKKNKHYDEMARISSLHASVHKSIAVVLGVGPLLIISVIYTQYFYASTIIIGKAWLSVIVLLIIAFLLLYLYKFTWERWQHKKALHLSIGILGSAILLFVPLIFIVNVVSMLYPDRWGDAQGFFHSLFHYPQIWQRYFHFILASLASGGFYLFVYFSFKNRKQAIAAQEHSLKKFGLKACFWITLMQIVFGFILLFSFEKDIRMLYLGEDLLLTSLLLLSILLTLILCAALYIASEKDNRKAFTLSIVTFVLILAVMGYMRHELRENYLQPYIDENPRTTELEAKITSE
ncbi:cytochrome ubiquinol oxidase subunit I [Lysinibacillus sp. 54212]|uniref:cytochrome ubiquinol oxidase subunit I n=1 Tax=Lysinibacillus sp. 54212 TaxID=3119829 RepID=UPI002FCAC91D